MSNNQTTLTSFFLQIPPAISTPMTEVAYTDIIPALHEYFKSTWAWEIADEKIVEDGTGVNIMTTVTLYTPGHIFTGRSYCKVKDYSVNHLHALVDASKTFTKRSNTQTSPQNNIQTSSSQQMSADQITAMLNQGQQSQMVDSAAQFYNYKDEQGRPADAVPYNNMTQNCTNELQQELHMPVSQPVPTPQPQQNIGKHGYTQAQIDRMNKFKKDFDITNDEMFGNYVNTWNKSLSSKKDINPGNIDAFLDWTDTLGE